MSDEQDKKESTEAPAEGKASSGPDFNKVAETAGKVLKEVGTIGGKLAKDMGKSVKEIISDYKNKSGSDDAAEKKEDKE